MRRPRKFCLLLAAIALLNFSPVTAGGLVLCIETDGHTRVERSRDGKCEDKAPSNSETSDQNCTPCVDYSFGSGPHALTSIKDAQTVSPQFDAAVFGLPLLPSQEQNRNLLRIVTHSLRQQVHLRSVVFRV